MWLPNNATPIVCVSNIPPSECLVNSVPPNGCVSISQPTSGFVWLNQPVSQSDYEVTTAVLTFLLFIVAILTLGAMIFFGTFQIVLWFVKRSMREAS